MNNPFSLKSESVLSSGPATYSKHPSRFPDNAPQFISSSRGPWVYDQDEENRFFDTISGLGATILGYGALRNDKRLNREIKFGGSYSLGSTLEIEAAEMLSNRFGYESVRFAKNGADAVQSAVRLARYVTGKQDVLCSGYHGMHDWYIASTKSNGGILPDVSEHTKQFQFFDWESTEELMYQNRSNLAAVVIEVPPMPEDVLMYEISDYLRRVEEYCKNRSIIFILDEIVTSSRYASDSEVEYPRLGLTNACGVTADLLCVGKGIANGFPISAVLGSADLMNCFRPDAVFMSTTFGGETYSLAAMMSTLERLNHENISNLRNMGSQYHDNLIECFRDKGLPATVLGDYARMTIQWRGEESELLKCAWVAEHIKLGILYGVPIFPMTCWQQTDVNRLTRHARKVANILVKNMHDGTLYDLIPNGRLPQDVFKRYKTT